MPNQQNLLRSDLDLLGQQYRVVLVGFHPFDVYDRLRAEHRLEDFTGEATPVFQTVLRDSLQAPWCQPRLGAAAVQVV